MATAVLESRVLYGLKTEITGNAHYITDSEILYPAGSALLIHNFSQRGQRLLRLPDKRKVNIIAVTPNKKYVAVCEVGDKPTINIYDIGSLKKKKSLGVPYEAPGVTRFNCVSFSHDSRCLAAVTGEPDQTMLFYAWEKGKVESSIKIGGSSGSPAAIEHVACNPGDVGVMALGGHCIFKFLTVSETVWRPYGFSKAENILICSMAWLNTDRLLVGTRDGRILYLENGDLKNIYKMSETNILNLKVREEYVMQTTASQMSLLENEANIWEFDIRCLTAFQRGFAYGHGLGTVIVFEREGPHKYTKKNVYTVPAQVSKSSDPEFYRISTISSNLSLDGLLVTTEGWSQLFHAKLWSPESLVVDPETPLSLKIMGQNLHQGAIGGLSVCAWKPFFMTSGEVDRSVRLWDYETESLMMMKQYQEDIFSVSLHPYGLFCLIGFSDKLRFTSILIDDFLTIHEIPVRNCRTVAFSHSGHLFAAVNGNIIQIYTTVGFVNRFLLKGHAGTIKNVCWSRDDMRLVSIGSDGAIYHWDMSNGSRCSEIILKGVRLNAVAISSDSAQTYCIADDQKIREMKEDSVSREFSLDNAEMEVLLMAKDDYGLLIGCPGGKILFVKFPLQEPLEIAEFHVHCDDIANICLSFDERVLLSTALDGTMCFWRVNKSEVTGRGPEITRTNEILIGRGDLEDKVRTIDELVLRMKELETENAYKIRQNQVQHNDKVRDMHQGYSEAIEELREKIEEIQEDRTKEINEINVDITKMKKSHEAKIQSLETNYEAKLIYEYDKYRAFEEHFNSTRENYELRLVELEKKWKEDYRALEVKCEGQLHAKSLELEESHEEMAHQVRLHEKIKEQIEEDGDREIVDLRSDYEAKLDEERQTILRLKGETGVLRNKYFATRAEIEDLKRQVNHLRDDHVQAQKIIRELQKDVLDLKKEITERDSTIQEKEKSIYVLRRDNQELEKFKFVLNYKIRELQGQIEPRDQRINELGEKIADMESELINLHKTNVSLELQLQELREKLGGSRKAMEMEISKVRKTREILKKIRSDLAITVQQHVQDPKALKNAVVKIYRLYCANADEELSRDRHDEMTAQCEFSNQRRHLEKTVISLKKQVFKKLEGDDKLNENKMMEENVQLIVEINTLREELEKARKRIAEMESLLGVSGLEIGPKEARQKFADACRGRDQLEIEYRSKMQDCEKIIATLQDDIKRLRGESDQA